MLLGPDRVNTLEKQWLDQTVALYEFAARHTLEIVVQNGKLNVFTQPLQLEFNERLSTTKDLFSKFQKAVQESVNQQKRARTAVGMAN